MMQVKLAKVDHSNIVDIFKCALELNKANKSRNNGGSRVRQRDAPTYYLATYLLKTESKWKNLDQEVPIAAPSIRHC